MLKGLSGLRTTLLAAGAAFCAGAAVATWVDAKFDDAAQKAAYENAIELQQKAFRERVQDMEQMRALDSRIIGQLQESIEKARSTERVVTKEVVRYVPKEGDGACNLTRGAVRLLNDARRPRDRGEAGRVPEASGLADDEARAPSSVDQRTEVSAHAECALRYEELRAKHGALIDWIEATYGEPPSD